MEADRGRELVACSAAPTSHSSRLACAAFESLMSPETNKASTQTRGQEENPPPAESQPRLTAPSPLSHAAQQNKSGRKAFGAE